LGQKKLRVEFREELSENFSFSGMLYVPYWVYAGVTDTLRGMLLLKLLLILTLS